MGHLSKRFSDRKIELWSLVEQVAARRSSRNRPAGSLETKSYFVTKESYKNLFLNSVILALQEKSPHYRPQPVIFQHDITSSHSIFDDEEVLIACNESRTVEIVFQPAKSPDFNVLDLEFFSSIHSLQN